MHLSLTYWLLATLRILVTIDMLLSQMDLSTGNVTHMIVDTRPSCFSRAMLKGWEWSGDEASVKSHACYFDIVVTNKNAFGSYGAECGYQW